MPNLSNTSKSPSRANRASKAQVGKSAALSVSNQDHNPFFRAMGNRNLIRTHQSAKQPADKIEATVSHNSLTNHQDLRSLGNQAMASTLQPKLETRQASHAHEQQDQRMV